MKSTKPIGSKDPQNPHAWIVNPGDKGRKAIKSNSKVYLQDGQNFELEIYNPLTESVLVDIKVNGSSVSESGLVIRPGERFYLDCFVDDKKKFIFNTYEVEDTDQSKEAIQKNGTVEFYFYKEETVNLKNWSNLFQPIIERHYYPVYPWYPHPWNIWYGTTTGGSTITTSNSISNITTNINLNSGNLNNSYYSNTGNTTYCSSNVDLNNMNFNSGSSYSNNIGSINSKIETGRIEKGENSNQQFVSVEMEFQKYHISSVAYQILPESQRPVETRELIKNQKKQKIKNLESELAELKKIVEQLTKK